MSPLNERWAEVQSNLGSEIESAPISGSVSPNILIRTEVLGNPFQNSSVLNMSETSLELNVEMLPDFRTIKEQFKREVSNENTCGNT